MMAGFDLQSYQGKKRLLLLFVPEPSSTEYVQQWQLLYTRHADLEDRDLVVISLFEEEVGDVDGEPVEPEEADTLRAQFRVKMGMAAALLIGKDGTEKRRFPMPVDPEALFRLIDSMPMRKDEMRGSSDT